MYEKRRSKKEDKRKEFIQTTSTLSLSSFIQFQLYKFRIRKIKEQKLKIKNRNEK